MASIKEKGERRSMKFVKNEGKRIISALMIVLVVIGAFMCTVGAASAGTGAAQNTPGYGLRENVQEGVILHAWNWSYNSIKDQMKLIAESGYSAVQTSPVTQPKDYVWNGKVYDNIVMPGNGGSGQWWKVYQPVSMSICDNDQTWFGTKAEFKAMCDEAEKYGVKVIVDIVANHMASAPNHDWENSMAAVSPQIGTYWNSTLLTDTDYWHINNVQVWHSDGRYDVTQGTLGMPDLNTQNKKVQFMVLDLLNECIENGADGFRFDAAKHIETPADSAAFAGDFWPTVLDGARDTYKKKTGGELYVYGEILNRIDDSKAEAYYRSVMSLTDNALGDNTLNSARYDNAGGMTGNGYAGYIGGNAKKAVLWAESHDTYASGPSHYANEDEVNQAWALVGTRKDATALYLARPFNYSEYFGKSESQLPDVKMGDVGSMAWASDTVKELNKFHNAFVGASERIGSDNNKVAYNVRGNQGVAIAKLDGPGKVSIAANGMSAGTYKDQISGNTFTVSGGKITGTIASADGVAVVYNPEEAPTADQPTTTKPGSTGELMLGDVNFDGKVTMKDILDIQKYIAYMKDYTADQKYVADVDKDGKVTMKDVLKIQRYIAGFINSF